MGREWPVAEKTSVSECEYDSSQPVHPSIHPSVYQSFSISAHLKHLPCVFFFFLSLDGEDNHSSLLFLDFDKGLSHHFLPNS